MSDIAIITDKDEIIPYDMLKVYIDEFHTMIENKSTILIVTSNTLGSVVGYVTCLKTGNVPLMVSKDNSYENINDYIRKYSFNYLWAPCNWFDNNEQFKKSRIIYRKFGYCLAEVNREKIGVNDRLALLLTTSGTTGSSKLVRISKENIESNTDDIINYLEINENDKAITILPMNYTYGLSVINTHLKCRGTILLTEFKVCQRKFWEFFNKYKGTSIAAVPYTYEMLLKLGFNGWKLDSLKTMTVAGGKIGISEEEYFIEYAEKYNKKFIVMYGQTEATARISYRPWKSAKKKSGSIGIPIPNGRIWLEDEKGNIITKPYTPGEIIYQGNNVTMGYAYELADLKKGDERKGILDTGDFGYMDNDNYFYILNRRDRNVKINGHRIDLKDMERKIRIAYPEYEVKCDIEKYMEMGINKRIRIELNKNCICRNKSDYEADTDLKDIRNMVSRQMNINQKMIYVSLIN